MPTVGAAEVLLRPSGAGVGSGTSAGSGAQRFASHHGMPRVGGTPPLSCALFDAGGTLIRVATRSAEVARIVLGRAGLAYTGAEVDRAMALADEQIDRRWHDGDWFSTESRVRQLFSFGYASALATLPGLGGERAQVVRLGGDMYDEYARPHHWTMYPDVVPTLSALADAGIALGVVSDWGRDLEGLLLELGLGRHFGSVVVSARMGVCKPDPAAFRLALDRLGHAPESAIHVGDSYTKDVLGAKAAGIVPVLVDRDGGAPDVDCPRIDSLSGLLGLVGLGAPRRERRGA